MNIDIEKLARHFTDIWWGNEIETSVLPKDLYENQIIEDTGMRLISEIKGEYAAMYLRKLEEYKQLIESYEMS